MLCYVMLDWVGITKIGKVWQASTHTSLGYFTLASVLDLLLYGNKSNYCQTEFLFDPDFLFNPF